MSACRSYRIFRPTQNLPTMVSVKNMFLQFFVFKLLEYSFFCNIHLYKQRNCNITLIYKLLFVIYCIVSIRMSISDISNETLDILVVDNSTNVIDYDIRNDMSLIMSLISRTLGRKRGRYVDRMSNKRKEKCS